jgi:NADH dehydrogenase/NADH:ubiquinone oxidoreductase subunit G
MTGRFVRLAETDRARLELRVDGRTITALEGDTLLTALLQAGRRLRASEFGDGERAGFCLMGACQDCWVWTEQGGRLRACSTFVTPGMSVVTEQPGATWPTPG